jgi:UDP-GlcNAc3NAcA epimerase
VTRPVTRKVATVVGARPQFVKAAAVSRAFVGSGVEEILIHTGQHYDANMSDIFFEELEIPHPKLHLGIGGGGHGAMTGAMLMKLEEAFIAEKPDAVLVYGDTNSTLAGALAAAKLHIPVVHSEAGLRSFNRRMPEELNRVVTDHLSALLLCPTHAAVANLASEGIAKGVHHVGDVMFDATVFAIERSKRTSSVIDGLGLRGERYAVCTLHRAENTDDPVRLAALIDFLAGEAKDRTIVFPVHPRTRKMLLASGLATPGLMLIDPLGYFDLHRLLADCEAVFTDSGGLQKEAYFHRKPCITLREETEWVETIDAGWNRLWTAPDFATPRREIADYGTGRAAEKTVELVKTVV